MNKKLWHSKREQPFCQARVVWIVFMHTESHSIESKPFNSVDCEYWKTTCKNNDIYAWCYQNELLDIIGDPWKPKRDWKTTDENLNTNS